MRRMLPTPLTSGLIFVVWLLLNNTLDPAHVLLAAGLAVAVPLATARMQPDRVWIRRWDVALRLLLVVLWDIVVANVEVARRILGPERAIKPRFVWIRLELRHPYGVLALAGMITMTPGTISSELTPDRRHLLVHALHVEGGEAGAAELVAAIKQRYERPLIEIFDGGGAP
jgi:multicomponent K+:H+ antiporter subunit E